MAPWENYQVKRFDQYRVTTYPQFVFFFKKSHIHTISAKHSKIKLSRPVHIIEVPKRKKRESDSIFQEIMAKNFPDYA